MPPVEPPPRSFLNVSPILASDTSDEAKKTPNLLLRGETQPFGRSQQGSSSANTGSDSTPLEKENGRAPRQIIVDSYAPRITCYTSTDADEFFKLKGFKAGLRELLSSFGERVQGKIVIRDSIGISREWDNFGVRYIDPSSLEQDQISGGTAQDSDWLQSAISQTSSKALDLTASIDELVQSHLDLQDKGLDPNDSPGYLFGVRSQRSNGDEDEPIYSFYLRKLLSSTPIVPHETFAHPIACIIAVGTRNTDPIESLRRLYKSSIRGQNNIPVWVNTDYLRYYVLIHDEENDDITKSTALFDLMKRHFGLHCHLLRLRGSQSVPTDDDSCRIPPCEWLSADDERIRLLRKGLQFMITIFIKSTDIFRTH